MKVVVLGAGLMGKEVARDLDNSDKVEKVFLADLDLAIATEFIQEANLQKTEAVQCDAENEEQLREVIAKGDVCVNALFYKYNEQVAKAAIDVGVHAVDLGGHIGNITENVLKLHEQAKEKNVTIIPDLGLAPGMINILVGYGASKLDKVDSIQLYVGGIPVKPEPPLNYTRVFSLEGVFDHYTQPSKIIRDGQLVEVDSLSGLEPIYFEQFGTLEAFYTSGGTSTLYKTFPNVKTLEYKTVRYKGHAEQFRLLRELGFFDQDNVVEVDGVKVKVRDVVREALKKKLYLGKKQDAVVLRAIIVGEKSGEQVTYEYETIIKREEDSDVTAMAKATAGTVASVAIMIGDGTISKRGVYPPETIVPGKEYIEKMNKRGVVIKETSHRSSIVKW
ncbi:saccharopine dehydrogenase family protein [Ureibacillus terrenus]|uniref:Saccharopine dehydrogenase n=1 Tax=Ureibacillus terrenus TaxID=118246 RepID=A0A540V5A9_9BACL|nr:saccharopine dehydrogenase C-terminal domain-containing protein [Ureibacillus terrenus]MED3661136.1 saccharopine dehydrogenase C-terminal domain-containing protein [Ureibacillus terrenus]MED3764386.1 saccharopine dehydrogenase C-terminal domain-containing protein [Ureibacillus terrenus]TQE91939.1 saccharopine dehydrogenase [Ureibacillus terrenus]